MFEATAGHRTGGARRRVGLRLLVAGRAPLRRGVQPAAVLAPREINHPIRIAERAATLDQLSAGRAEIGLTRSTPPEWRLFGADPATVRSGRGTPSGSYRRCGPGTGR
ncbi:LLM class flavin-dependent oxidoreductase [Streptomyces sp. AS02]|uniref:LLM class flavin-dependent oxidoreductase n=1 Tax=Streptomyces sp. AS02 TaxID=2938946 RepID=UPI00202130D3|nr:LLM class flavin-dependent oxidoreductase [Streptomyces sp. AS02]MCL8014810.1 LLM class flavin-dependent oxidoreductase [Streptomyces sp. AS02]